MGNLRNRQVIEQFAAGNEANSWTGNLWSDGTWLRSYNQRIAHRTSGGLVVVGNFTSPGGRFFSVTTSSHVNSVKVIADEIMHPTVFVASVGLWPDQA
jgi:hypothetical protein